MNTRKKGEKIDQRKIYFFVVATSYESWAITVAKKKKKLGLINFKHFVNRNTFKNAVDNKCEHKNIDFLQNVNMATCCLINRFMLLELNYIGCIQKHSGWERWSTWFLEQGAGVDQHGNGQREIKTPWLWNCMRRGKWPEIEYLYRSCTDLLHYGNGIVIARNALSGRFTSFRCCWCIWSCANNFNSCHHYVGI